MTRYRKRRHSRRGPRRQRRRRDGGRYNPNLLYRDPRNGRIMGVCAGIADYFDVRPGFVRLMTVILAQPRTL